eukprot:EG_transcript_34700
MPVLSIAALLGVATCSYLLGAMWSGAQSQQYATAAAAVRTTWRPQPLIAGVLTNSLRPSQIVGPLSATPTAGDVPLPGAAAHSDAKVKSWLLPIIGLGSVVVGALLFAWTKPAGLRRPLADEWRAAAVELEEGFPGPGNPNDEFEVTVVWGGEERKLKVKGDQSILMACEEA